MACLWLLWGTLLGWAVPLFPTWAASGNRSAGTCNFVCDTWDCSDESQCGYQNGLAPPGAVLTCDFEGTTCGWQDISTSAHRWRPRQGGHWTWGADPPFDHTLGTDHGWYLSASWQRAKPPAAPACLCSPTLTDAASTCEVHAWYSLAETGLNESLTVELHHGDHHVTLWRSPPSSPGAWHPLLAYTGRVHGAFQVIFSSLVSVALDDVEFRNCGPPTPRSCTPCQPPCLLGGWVAPTRLCDGTEDCGDGSDERDCEAFHPCPFEEGWCGWAATPSQNLSWVRNCSSQAPLSPAHPTRDHSTNTRKGYFIYVSGTHPGQAELVSPTLAPNSSCHLVLYAHLHGSDANRLNIYSQTKTGPRDLIRSRAGNLGNFWFREEATFHATEDFQIVLEGVIGTDPQSSIALDDLILSPGCVEQSGPLFIPPGQSPTQQPCEEGQFFCDRGGHCVDAERVCNFEPDCEDGSDESQCGAGNFSQGLSGWMDVSVGRLQWVSLRLDPAQAGLGHPGGPSATAPPVAPDSVLGLSEAPGQMLSLARATTPPLGPSGLACALEMEFSAGPRGLLALAVSGAGGGAPRWLWHAQGNGTAMWERTIVALGARERPFKLELLATEELAEQQGKALLAVGSITWLDCSTNASLARPTGLSCNFESDQCGWFAQQGGGFEWRRSTGQDHTTGRGSFLLADPSVAGSRGWQARLVSAPQAPPTPASACLSFWYRLEGPQIGTLRLLVKYTNAAEEELWSRTGSQGATWRHASATIPWRSGQSFQATFEALRDGFVGSAALDDVALTPGACAPPERCSFEEASGCGLSGGGRWAWEAGASGRGPPADHTLGTAEGHYMVANTSADSLAAGASAPLQTGPYPPLQGTHCISFWYFLSAGDAGSLRASVEDEGGRAAEGPGAQARRRGAWHYANFTAMVGSQWRVTFVAEGAGGTPSSYVALDDLQVAPGSCLATGSCDFESGTCGWRKPHGDWLSWDWQEGAKAGGTLRPATGHFVSIHVAHLGTGHRPARLASETLPATEGAACFRFRYHMDSEAELRVLLSGPQGERVAWQADGQQGWAWQEESLVIESASDFQVVLEAGASGWPGEGAIAVDDVVYVAGGGCEEQRQGSSQEGSSASSSPPGAAIVAGLTCALLGGLLVWVVIRCFRSKRQASGTPQFEGFDNVAFRDDQVRIAELPVSMATG